MEGPVEPALSLSNVSCPHSDWLSLRPVRTVLANGRKVRAKRRLLNRLRNRARRIVSGLRSIGNSLQCVFSAGRMVGSANEQPTVRETETVSRTVGCSFADPTILPAEKTHCKLLPIDRKPLTMRRARLRSRFRSRLFARTLRPFASTVRTGRRDSQSE